MISRLLFIILQELCFLSKSPDFYCSFGGTARNYRLYYDGNENSHFVGKINYCAITNIFSYQANVFSLIVEDLPCPR